MLTKDRLNALRSDYNRKIQSVEDTVGEAIGDANEHPKTGSTSQLGLLGRPIKGKFSYSIWRSKTEEIVTVLRKAESDLDQQRKLQRTSPWTEPTTVKDSSSKPSLDTSFQELDLNRQLLTERTLSDTRVTVQKKVKAKTRKNAVSVVMESDRQEVPHAANEHEGIEDINTTDQKPKFMVNARALKLFQTIFFAPSIEGTPGEVAWNDFLYAMTSIGFAAEAIGGSRWHFHPMTVDVKHGIVFNGPHPKPKMSYWVARNYGTRLIWAYGWESSMFALR